jgi:hypothetical protein
LNTGEALGSLVPHLGGFVNWILSCPQEYLNELTQGGSKITELISQDSIHINPLHVFVKDCLVQNKESHVKLANLKEDYDIESLFNMYKF